MYYIHSIFLHLCVCVPRTHCGQQRGANEPKPHLHRQRHQQQKQWPRKSSGMDNNQTNPNHNSEHFPHRTRVPSSNSVTYSRCGRRRITATHTNMNKKFITCYFLIGLLATGKYFISILNIEYQSSPRRSFSHLSRPEMSRV